MTDSEFVARRKLNVAKCLAANGFVEGRDFKVLPSGSFTCNARVIEFIRPLDAEMEALLAKGDREAVLSFTKSKGQGWFWRDFFCEEQPPSAP